MKKFFLLIATLVILLSSCGSSSTETVRQSLIGNTYYRYNASDSNFYDVNGYSYLMVEYMIFNPDGTITEIEIADFEHSENSPFKNNESLQDYTHERTQDSYVIKKSGGRYELDIGGYGILVYTLEVDDALNVKSVNFESLKYKLWRGYFE